MSTPEHKVKVRIVKLLKEYGCYYEAPVPTGFGKSGLDYMGCHEGRFFAIEAKAPGKKPTPRQELTMQAIRDAGGAACWTDGDLSEIERWLNE